MDAKVNGKGYVDRVLAEAEFFEAQIFGGVSLDDIEYIALPRGIASFGFGDVIEKAGVSWRLWEDHDHA